jgi:hypothetical protein
MRTLTFFIALGLTSLAIAAESAAALATGLYRNRDGNRQPGGLRSQRYYEGLLTMLAVIEGNFRIYGPTGSLLT